ncbi:hypothetical protein CBR_g40618 [Chara braunii]|uniref:Uncharacterized protein n=1 Tax=Chara braunii TaxID=69332 RepID=A0A388LU05_CHABU|nr:hypothetical protein CBR_g40618 [Chara braunii]|eukprot:GBG85808.1 hypothetical protein CBR_g40618 [Chara braunii]
MAERWQELDVGHGGIDFLGGFVIGAAGEGIGNAVALARGVTNGKDGGDDGVIGTDGEVLPIEVRAPDFEGVDQGEELLLVGWVVHFCGKEFLAGECDGVLAGWALGVSRGVLDGGVSTGLGGKCWDKTAPMAKSEASVVTKKWRVGSAILRTGAVVMSSLSLSKVAWRRSVQATGSVARDGENLAEMIKVGLEGGAKNKDVVEVDHDTDFEEVAEDVVHGGLECGRGVGETERHYEKLVVPEAGVEGGLVGVLLADADLVEATAEVDLGEVFGSTEAIKKFGYPGKQILVLDRDPVQGAVVCAHAEFRGAVLLDEETAGSEAGGARLNEFIELALHFFGLGDGELVWGAARGGVVGLEIDGVGNTSPVEERPALRTQASVMKLPVAPMSRRARNFTVNAPKKTATNLSWNWAVSAQMKEIMVLRRRCSRPNLTSRVCRSCSSTRSEKVMLEGLGRRVVEHVAVGCSADGIEDVVGRRAGGVDCDTWGVSGVKVVAGGGVGRRIVGARTWLQGAGGQCSSGGGSRGCGGGGGSGCGRAGSGGAGSLVAGAASLGAIGLLMPQLEATETTDVGVEEGAFGGGELFETRGLGGGGRMGGQALPFHPHEMDNLEVFLGGCGGEPMSEGHVVEIEGILNLREEKEDVLVGEAGERRDISGAEGVGNVPVVGDDASEGVEAGVILTAVVGRGVVAGVILTVVTKEVARRRLGYGGVNARKDLGVRGVDKGDGGSSKERLGDGGGGRGVVRVVVEALGVGCEEGREMGREVTGVEEGVVKDGGGVVLEDEAWPAWPAERLWPDWPEEGGWLFWPEEDGWPVWPAGVDWMDWPEEEGGDDVVTTVMAGVWFSREVT